MNMIAETVIHDVSDPCHSARHAVRRDPPPTGSAWDESDYWMGLSIRYGRGKLACLLAAMALSSIGVAAGMALSVLFLVPSALLGFFSWPPACGAVGTRWTRATCPCGPWEEPRQRKEGNGNDHQS